MNSKNKLLRLIAIYLILSFGFDIVSGVIQFLYEIDVLPNSLFITIKITYRLIELLIIGYLINKYWLQSTVVWYLIAGSSVYLLYDLCTYKANGILNYEANAQTVANLLLMILIAVNLLKQLRSNQTFTVTNQMLSMVFLAYFSIHLIYTVIQNFIINQSFSDKSFVLFYSSYVVLHIAYYFALAFILFKNLKKHK
ncbi:hypothetical protein MG290_06740 [Flavobacterium sp. CBA20B-1]|uniref:hypothetical protein n=1 Tax=unclassified Flavobacterium TaxID=196869 RepID=UPI00222455DE|nr:MULTISPECIES: hypothetical protein [unclassified Flavobacterium]WCM43353.1 hypothetical protein MG290_06740 [Flavobacterium sp. CBA20B-1]